MAEETDPKRIEIAGGRAVWLRTELKARDFHALPRAVYADLGTLPFDEQIVPLTKLVAKWEGFAGDPADPQAWADLDVFGEMVPLWSVIQSHVAGLIRAYGERLKN